MKKRMGIFWAMVILIGIPFAANAAESSEADERAVKSYGTIVYEDKNGSVRFYAEDIILLQEKLASIPEEIFDPVLYSHTHVWEYIDVTDRSHIKHCDICGSRYDLINEHSEAAVKACTITLNGHDYPGYEKACECGYTWQTENGHSLIYTSKDENYHSQSCALDGTSYCMGIEKVDLPHNITLYPTDQTHHQKRCSECGYQGDIEECIFDLEEQTTDIQETDSISERAGETATEVRKYCVCGNYITEPKTDVTVSGEEALPQIETGADEELQELQTESEATEEKTEISNIKPQIPEITVSVSGNDCKAENKIQDKIDETIVIEQEGENNL